MIYCNMCQRKFYQGMTCNEPKCELQLYNLSQPCKEPDRWTMEDDPDDDPRPGWKWLKFDKIWWFPKLDGYVKWHDKVTKFCSIAQRVGVTVKQINASQKSQLKDKGLAGYAVDNVLRPIQRFVYSGKIK